MQPPSKAAGARIWNVSQMRRTVDEHPTAEVDVVIEEHHGRNAGLPSLAGIAFNRRH
jgi:hypothetical protein